MFLIGMWAQLRRADAAASNATVFMKRSTRVSGEESDTEGHVE